MNDFEIILCFIVLMPAVAGLVCAVLPRKLVPFSRMFTLAMLVLVAGLALILLVSSRAAPASASPLLYNDALARTMTVVSAVMALLIFVYSLSRPLGSMCSNEYCGTYLLTVGLAHATFFCNNLLLLAVLWGALGITLFILVNCRKTDAAASAAKKSLIIIGATDSLLIVGLGLLWILRGGNQTLLFSQTLAGSPVGCTSALAVVAFLCLLSAALAKAGALPFHTWVPDVAETTYAPVSALLPASLDKALGIYLILRLIRTLFQVDSGSFIQILMLAIGALTIVTAVFMALIQHDLKRLLGYHAVSQVGYMVLGIATLTPVGILGGVFHMVNHIMYKSLLFLGAGSVESRTGTTNLDELGGLGRAMPVTFACMTVGALAISGVPPLNGFMSKWLIYQGTIELGPGGFLWIVWLTAAMFGSALTLASFIKVLHAVFLANPARDYSTVKESGLAMRIPMLLLAIGCILFGVFAWSIPIKGLLIPAMNVSLVPFYYLRPVIVTFLLVISLLAGLALYALSKLKLRRDPPHIGGQVFTDSMKLSGTDFYQTIADLPFLKTVYRLANQKWFDVYELGIRLTNYITGMLRAGHQGYLNIYVTWCIVGLAIVIWLFFQ